MKRLFVVILMVLMMINLAACAKENDFDLNAQLSEKDIIKDSSKEVEVPASESAALTSNCTKKVLIAYF